MRGGRSSTATEALALEGVTLAYGDTLALDDVSLSVAEGERVCVLGANGSGKSTLASVVAGLLAPDAGTVRMAGRVVRSDAEGVDFAAYAAARRQVGLVFQSPDDQIVTTVVEEDVAFGPENLGVAPSEIDTRVERELRRVAMDAFAKADPTTLSGGQKQRVAIAGALAMEPRVLVLDEPGALLDVRGRRGIMRVMDELHEAGITIMHVTHFMDEALAADRVVVLEAGRVVAEGRPSAVFSRMERHGMRGLELPFAARVAARLRETGIGVPFTCDEDELVACVAELVARAGAEPQDGTNAHADGERDDERAEGAAARGRDAVVVASDVAYSYADADGHGFRALDGTSLRVEEGTRVAVVGHTGSGKSTLLRLLCALDAPDEGKLRVLGVDTARRRDRRRLHGRVGYVMQHPERQLFAETVWDDVAFGPRNLGLSEREVDERVRGALSVVGLEGREDASPFQLSGGQQRLCAIAGVLAMRPGLLVLDEPTAGLDPQGRARLRRLLADVNAGGTTVVEVTHSMNDAARADQVIMLAEGRVLVAGRPDEVFDPAHAQLLRAHGLGLPQALTLALRLEEAGLAPLGRPLSVERCVTAIRERLAAAGAYGASGEDGTRGGA